MWVLENDARSGSNPDGSVRRLGLFALVAVFCLSGLGCDAEIDGARDGGVLSTTPLWGEDEAWTLSQHPLLQLGEWREGAETFDGIRAARHISDTEIAVIDGTTATVRVFDLSGSLVAQIGREGNGPGEFQFANHVEEIRDTIYVADERLGRVSRFERSGRFIDQVQLPEELRGPTRIVGIYPAGSLLVQSPGMGSRAVANSGMLPPDTTTWYRYSPTEGTITPLASGIAMEVYGHQWAGGFALGEVVFGARAHAALDESTLLVAQAEHGFEIEMVDSLGTWLGWFGLGAEPTSTTPDDVRRYIDLRIRSAPRNTDTEAWRRVFEDAPVRDRFPSTGRILVDGSGAAWVQHFERPGAPERWAVFRPDRQWLGDLELPANTTLFDVGYGHVVAAHEDDLGVEKLVVYELNRPEVDEP